MRDDAPAFELSPGRLVKIKTAIKGNKKQKRQVVEPEHVLEDGVATQQSALTVKRINDPSEQREAELIRGRAVNHIESLCTKSDFGHLCPETRVDLLREREREAYAMVDDFNANSRITTIEFHTLFARVPTDEEAVARKFCAEMADLMEGIADAVAEGDAESARDMLKRVESIATDFLPQLAESANATVDLVRTALRRIAKTKDAAAAKQIAEEAVEVAQRQAVLIRRESGAHATE
jgi:hypothetical protein